MSKRLPTITSDIPRDLRNFVDRLREMVASNGNDRLLSVTELKDAGVVGVNANGSVYAMATGTGAATEVFGSPPAPTGVTASPAIQNVIVTWDIPPYPTHAYAEVWGASTNDIGAAELLGQTPGGVYVDALGPSATRYYWVRFVNTQFTTGAYNSTYGTSATTGPDLAYTMDVLSDAYGVTSDAPFFQLSASTVINGVTIPAGTYMKAAYIYDGVITNAKIANAAIDNAKVASLDAGKITTGFISADRVSSGSLDAKIASIDAAAIGTGFINAARINTASIANANIGAAQITSGTIDSARVGDIQSTDYVAGSAGWRIAKSGAADLNNATFRGTLDVKSAATGARLQITSTQILVYDASGTLRVKIGAL